MRRLLSMIMLCVSTMVSASTLHNLVVFGDSLSDNGNLYEYMKHKFPVAPYYEGRFTNGKVWIEQLADYYFPQNTQQHFLDYAYAGAAVSDEDDGVSFTLRTEINSYLLSHADKADPDSLYVIWIGANNYLALPDDPEKVVQEVGQGINAALQKLIDKGARHFFILNMPDLGFIPAAREYDAVDTLHMMSVEHNALLEQTITTLHERNPSVEFVSYDVFSAMTAFLQNPSQYGFTNVADTCYESVDDDAPGVKTGLAIAAHIKVKTQASPCDGYLFFDPVHPTALGHEIFAEQTRKALEDSGVDLHG